MAIVITQQLVTETLKAFSKRTELPEAWHASALFANNDFDINDRVYALEVAFKTIITDNLAQMRDAEGVSGDYRMYVDKYFGKDSYASIDSFSRAIQTDCNNGSSRSHLKYWSTLYHYYFIHPLLDQKSLAAIIGCSDRTLRSYRLEGEKLLANILNTREREINEALQITGDLAPSNLLELHAENQVTEAQGWLALGKFQQALDKCDEAFNFACENDFALQAVLATTTKVYTLLHAPEPQPERALTLIDNLEKQHILEDMPSVVHEAYANIEIKLQRAFVYKRFGHVGAAAEVAAEAVKWTTYLMNTKPIVCGEAYRIQGVMLWADGQYIEAVNSLEQALEIFQDQGNSQYQYYTFDTLALIKWSLTQYQEAEHLLHKAIHLAEKNRHYWRLAYQKGNLALIHLSRRELQQSIDLLTEQEKYSEMASAFSELERARANKGVALLHQGKLREAEVLLEAARIDYETRNRQEGLLVICTNLAQLHTRLGNHLKASEYAQFALRLASEQGEYVPGQVLALRSLAACASNTDADRIAALNEALRIAKQINRRFDEAACLLALSSFESVDQREAYWHLGVHIFEQIHAERWIPAEYSTTYPQILLIM